jgi:transcriptional regulator GlxA family with amidase domain
MSERTFLRHFTRSIGMTPARFIETLRLDQTGVYLAAGMSLKEIARKSAIYPAPNYRGHLIAALV